MKSFFRVPMRVHHGLLLATYLAANHESGQPISLDEIAAREKISQGFLEEIANGLRQAGIIEGKRGPKGGYILCKSPQDVTVAQVIEAIEGPVTLVDCLMEDAACPSEHGCSNRRIWKTVQERITDTLEGIPLTELVTSKYTTTRV